MKKPSNWPGKEHNPVPDPVASVGSVNQMPNLQYKHEPGQNNEVNGSVILDNLLIKLLTETVAKHSYVRDQNFVSVSTLHFLVK